MKEMVVPAKLNIHFLMPFSKSVIDFAFTVMTKKKQLWLITTHKIRSADIIISCNNLYQRATLIFFTKLPLGLKTIGKYLKVRMVIFIVLIKNDLHVAFYKKLLCLKRYSSILKYDVLSRFFPTY